VGFLRSHADHCNGRIHQRCRTRTSKGTPRTQARGNGSGTLRKVYGTLHTLFRDAVIEELVEHTPCVLSSKELGLNEDKDPEWRATAVYDRDELIVTVQAPTVPARNRIISIT
jgi:hypothetical protein